MKLIIAAMVSALLLSACATSGNGTDGTIRQMIVDATCDWAKPIFVSRDDQLTEQTAEQILSHNEKFDAICRKNLSK